MAFEEAKLMRKRLVSAYLSSLFSISLVLLLVGLASLLLVNASNVSSYVKEHMRISLIFAPQASDERTMAIFDDIQANPCVRSVEYVSKEQGVREMEELLGTDFLSVFDTDPIPVSLNISLKADYVTDEKIDSLSALFAADPSVADVVWQKSLVDKLNANIRTISGVLAVFIALLLFISYVLIGNTVRLNLFSKRFSVHTMRLVGATKAFIRAPFLMESAFQAVLATEIATLVLVGGLLYVKTRFAQLFTVFQLNELLVVIGIMLVSGLVICLATTFLVVGRMVSLKKDELYV